MNTSKQILHLAILSAIALPLQAQDEPVAGDQKPFTNSTEQVIQGVSGPVDISSWKCKFCEFEEGMTVEVEAGLGHVSDDSFKFGEFNGLNEKGAYFIGNANARYRGEDAFYWDINVTDLGLESRVFRLEGGRQGSYKLILGYEEWPQYFSDSAVTPFLGSGGGTLSLPAGWVTAGSTSGMTSLASSLNEVELETKRQRLEVSVSLVPAHDWETTISFRHELKEGTKRIAGAFNVIGAAQLIQPVDYTTDLVEASVSYAGSKSQAKLSYSASIFSNSNESLTWENPFLLPVAGTDRGQLALPPDNQFHQIRALLGYNFNDRMRTTADFAIGRMTQDENFLAPTLNPNIAVAGPSVNSLDGQVDTLNASLKVIAKYTDHLSFNAAYLYNDRANKTPQSTYSWVETDMNVATPRVNLPYSFTRSTFRVGADYQPFNILKASLDFESETYERTYQEVEETQEDSVLGSIDTRLIDTRSYDLNLKIKLGHANREANDYEVVPEISPPENPLLRKYNMADRSRDSTGLRVDLGLRERIYVGIEADYFEDDYSDSAIGLKSGEELNYGIDASLLLGEKTSVYIYLDRAQIESRMANSATFFIPNWEGDNKDVIDTVGIGLKHNVIENKFDIGVDLAFSHSTGEITVAGSDFPDLITKLDSLKLYGTYKLSDKMSLDGTYWYERYDTDDWSLDGVAVDTLLTVLTLGEEPPSYRANVVSLSMRYKF